MNGQTKLLLDTNALIAYFAGHQHVVDLVDHAIWVGLSVVSVLEFLAFGRLSASDVATFRDFCDQVVVVPLAVTDAKLCDEIVRLRRDLRLKLPDAIVAASAGVNGAALVTADAQLATLQSPPVIPFVP